MPLFKRKILPRQYAGVFSDMLALSADEIRQATIIGAGPNVVEGSFEKLEAESWYLVASLFQLCYMIFASEKKVPLGFFNLAVDALIRNELGEDYLGQYTSRCDQYYEVLNRHMPQSSGVNFISKLCEQYIDQCAITFETETDEHNRDKLAMVLMIHVTSLIGSIKSAASEVLRKWNPVID